MKPNTHSLSSARQFGGEPEDYMEIHEFLDHTKMMFPDNRHRALLHNSWGIYICERVFGPTFKNSDGTVINTRSIAEQHIFEDYGNKFIPTPQDFLQLMEHEDWMSNMDGAYPSSMKKIKTKKVVRKVF